MKHDVPVRVIVMHPLEGVWMKVQRGRDELLEPVEATPDRVVFEFTVKVDLSGGAPNFLGPYSQGPKDARFVYVNSGTYAGQPMTCWSRRAKLSLRSVTSEMIEALLARPKALLEATINGIGRDGGPVCASVQNLEWRVGAK